MKKTHAVALALVLLSTSACASVHEAMHGKRATEPTVHLTLVPLEKPEPGKTTTISAKVTYLKTRLLVTHAELKPQASDALTLYALDNSFNDFQAINASATSTDGLYQFAFTPHSSGYRIWAESALKTAPESEFPFADIGARGLGKFTRTETLQQNWNGTTATLVLDEKPIRFHECNITLQLGGTNADIKEIIGFYDDFRTVIHLKPENGKGINYSPDQEGFIKLFVRFAANGKEATLPFTISVAKD